MKLGVHLSNHGDAAQAVALAQAADRAGIDHLWIAEDLFFAGAVPIAGAIAATTKTATVGFGVLTPYGRHPSVIAMDLAALQQLAPDRVIFGLGSGVQARIERRGDSWQNPVRMVRDTVESVRRLLEGETLTLENAAGRFDGLSISYPMPVGAPPVYVAAVGPRALEQAGRLFDGVLLTVMASPTYVRWAAEIVAGAERDVPAEIVASVPVRVSEDRAQARAEAQRLVGGFIARWQHIPSLREMFTVRGPLSDSECDDIAERLNDGEAAESVVPVELALEYCAAGTLADVAAQLRRWHDAGATEVGLEFGDAVGPDEVEPFLRELIREVGAG